METVECVTCDKDALIKERGEVPKGWLKGEISLSGETAADAEDLDIYACSEACARGFWSAP